MASMTPYRWSSLKSPGKLPQSLWLFWSRSEWQNPRSWTESPSLATNGHEAGAWTGPAWQASNSLLRLSEAGWEWHQPHQSEAIGQQACWMPKSGGLVFCHIECKPPSICKCCPKGWPLSHPKTWEQSPPPGCSSKKWPTSKQPQWKRLSLAQTFCRRWSSHNVPAMICSSACHRCASWSPSPRKHASKTWCKGSPSWHRCLHELGR